MVSFDSDEKTYKLNLEKPIKEQVSTLTYRKKRDRVVLGQVSEGYALKMVN
jgi:hypothetical protein